VATDRTFVTELATGLGMLGGDDVGATIAGRPASLANLGDAEWERLDRLWDADEHREDFGRGIANGRAFLAAADALNGRPPRIVEWTGPRRAPGDEVVPADLRVDHVYLVSCKYLSKVLHNSSPQRLVEGLLGHGPLEERGDWYQAVAAPEHEALYTACVRSVGSGPWPVTVNALDREQRRRLRTELGRDWPAEAVEPYARLCTAVAAATARRWAQRITPRNREAVLWRLLRVGSAPYFVLGANPAGSMRLRIDTPWDWRQHFELRALDIAAQPGGQPRVGWTARYRVRATGEERAVEGHVELRWSHGRFSGPPEAKVYLDTPHEQVPGYHLLEPAEPAEPAVPVGSVEAAGPEGDPAGDRGDGLRSLRLFDA
jgi:hypothetical protein